MSSATFIQTDGAADWLQVGQVEATGIFQLARAFVDPQNPLGLLVEIGSSRPRSTRNPIGLLSRVVSRLQTSKAHCQPDSSIRVVRPVHSELLGFK
jgi:hypothetical protein